MNLARQLMERIYTGSKLIVVCGDSMTDVWVHGSVSECQEGCTKFTEDKIVHSPGGVANARRCLSSWEARTIYYARSASDRPIKTRFLVDGKIVFRYDNESIYNEAEVFRLSRRDAINSIENCDAVLLSDYDKGFLTPEFMRKVIDTCIKRNIPCVVDAKRHPDLYKGAIIKGNGQYFSKWGKEARKKDSQCVTTYGDTPPLVWNCGKPEMSTGMYNLSEVPCVNHVGAGDCFAATLTLALAHDFSLLESTVIAHSAGRVYVQHPHNRAPLPNEVVADMDNVKKSPTMLLAASGKEDGPGHV